MGCHFLLKGIFPTQGSNPCLLHWQVGSLPLSCQGSPETEGSIPGLGRSTGEENSYPLQYFGLENSTDCIVYRVAESWAFLSDFHFHIKNKHIILVVVPKLKCVQNCLVDCVKTQLQHFLNGTRKLFFIKQSR